MSSFGQIASATIMTDVTNLIIGFAIVFTYVNLMLGKFNMVEQRVSYFDIFLSNIMKMEKQHYNIFKRYRRKMKMYSVFTTIPI